MNIKYRGQYEKKQYFKGMFLAAKQPRSNTIKRIAIFAGFTALYGIMVYYSLQQEEVSSHDLSRIFKHLITVVVLGYAIFRPVINTYSNANKLWKDPIIRAPRHGAITDDGICYYDQVTKGWDIYILKRITDDMVVLVSTAGNIAIFPRHFFQDENDWNEFRQAVEFKVVEAI